MRKLKLDATTLRVESFEAYAGPSGAGTVRANVLTPECSGEEGCGPTDGFQDTCAGCANTSPRPSCMDCSWDDACVTVPPNCD
jgi:hypothetical protein